MMFAVYSPARSKSRDAGRIGSAGGLGFFAARFFQRTGAVPTRNNKNQKRTGSTIELAARLRLWWIESMLGLRMTTGTASVFAVALIVSAGLSLPARAASIYEVGDATHGAAAIDITFSWDGNPHDALTNFSWSTPLNNSIVDGTVSDAFVLFLDSFGFPFGFTDLADYLLSGDATWSEDCTGSAGVSPASCGLIGSHIDLNIRDFVVGTYGFEISRQRSLAQVDAIASGTLVNLTANPTTAPEPTTLPLIIVGLLALAAGAARHQWATRTNGTPPAQFRPDR